MNDYLTIFTLVIGSFLVQEYETITPTDSMDLFELLHASNSRVDDIQGIELLTPEMSNPIEGFPFSLLCQWHHQHFQNPSAVWRLTSPNQTTITYMNATYTPIQDIRINMNTDDASKLIWSNVPMNANGSSFACILNNTYTSPNYTMNVESHLLKTNVSADSNYIEQIYVDPGMTLALVCPVDATFLPRPQVEWTNLRGVINDSIKFTFNNTDDASILSLDILPGFMADEFKCTFISNSTTNSTTTYTFRVRMMNKPFTIWHNVGFFVAAIAFLILIALLIRAIHLKMKQKKMTRIIRGKLLQGDPRNVNPDVPLEGQVALLPYDSKWEFPRNRLVLGKQLGSGQFGFVVEARALGTVQDLKDRTVRQVAVKMVKPSVDPTALVFLASELKILIHLGPHSNVVNLLGACTKNVIEGELLIIEEFCRYGNLRDYLIANRKSFVNELDDKGILKPLNSENIRDRNLVLSSLPDSSNNYSNKRCLNRTNSAAQYHNSTTSYNNTSKHLVYKMLGYNVPERSPNEVMECRLTVDREDANLEPKKEIIISTRDLIYWSIQIARGMEHLASKKVIHGDLTAHNILLTEGNVVKIANFGLPRQTKYNYDGNYLKKGPGENLSIKWMAIESLIDRIFSTESDIWSYGVVLWEMFSLGQIPYADITTLKDLIRFLRDGQRLEEPVFSPVLVGRLMTRCWEKKPRDRPIFSEIEREFGNLLG